MLSKQLKKSLVQLMSITQEYSEEQDVGLDQEAIEIYAAECKLELGISLDSTYLSLMKENNGLFFNGLSLYPLLPHLYHESTLLQINLEMKNDFSGDYLCYGAFDEVLYCYHVSANEYISIKKDSDFVINHFDSADEMFIFMFKRAIVALEY